MLLKMPHKGAFFICGRLWGEVVNCGTIILNNHYFRYL
jgi:hypothetical protein